MNLEENKFKMTQFYILKLYKMDALTDSALEQMFSTILAEHTRVMAELKNTAEKFDENCKLETLVSQIMKSILKLKAYKQKLRMKE